MFKKIYRQTLIWAQHRHAVKYLCGLSFAESAFFPVPPDVMLVPMVLAQSQKAFKLAALTTLFSVLGGVLGYCIGFFLFDAMANWLQQTHYWTQYLTAKTWFNEWGFWAILIAGFSPIPYKVFTITAGTLQMVVMPFLIASLIGRGARFFLVAILLAWGGKQLEVKLHQYIDYIGWGVVLIIMFGLVIHYSLA